VNLTYFGPGNGRNMTHRGRPCIAVYYKPRDTDNDDSQIAEGWYIDDHEHCIVQFTPSGPYTLGPAHHNDDDNVLDVGDFPTLEAAAVAATLLEQP